MNLLNQKLSAIRRQKKIYYTKMKETNDQQELYSLSRKIMELDKEETEILKNIGEQ